MARYGLYDLLIALDVSGNWQERDSSQTSLERRGRRGVILVVYIVYRRYVCMYVPATYDVRIYVRTYVSAHISSSLEAFRISRIAVLYYLLAGHMHKIVGGKNYAMYGLCSVRHLTYIIYM